MSSYDGTSADLARNAELNKELTELNNELSRRGGAGCVDCATAARSMDMDYSRTIEHKVLEARRAVSECYKCNNFPRGQPTAPLGMGYDPTSPNALPIFIQPIPIKNIREVKRIEALQFMLDTVQGPYFSHFLRGSNDLTWFNGSHSKVDAALATTSPFEAARAMVLDLVKNIQERESRVLEHQTLLLTCLCKVLEVKGVSANEIIPAFAGSVGRGAWKNYLLGVIWVNRLLESLYWRGWGHGALALPLAWNFHVREYGDLSQGEDALGFFLDELEKPQYKRVLPLISGYTSKSIPAILYTTLHGLIHYSDICKALGYSSLYAEATEAAEFFTAPAHGASQNIDNAGRRAPYSGYTGGFSPSSGSSTSFLPSVTSHEMGNLGSYNVDMPNAVGQAPRDKLDVSRNLDLRNWLIS